MEGEFEKQKGLYNFSALLELSAMNDLVGFKTAVEEESHDIDGASLWYGRKIGSKRMGYEDRTPLMIAAMFGSKDVLLYILQTGLVDVNRSCGSDRATALHCAVAGGSTASAQIVQFLLDASADSDALDSNGNRPSDLISPVYSNSRKNVSGITIKGSSDIEETFCLSEESHEALPTWGLKDGVERKEYPVDLSLPDIKNAIYSTDEFRMYTFKIQPCSRAYSHDWTECPFVHPGENARRRDPRKYHYSCVPCPEFRKGSCREGDACEYAHGIFECWLHPAQYRTRLCKDESGCTRRVCFFAHKPEELRPLYASTGSAVPSPRSFSGASDMGPLSPLGLESPSGAAPSSSVGCMWPNQCNVTPPTMQLPNSRLKAARRSRVMELDIELLRLENQRSRQKQLMDEISSLSSPSGRNNKGLSSNSGFNSPRDITGELNRLSGRVNPTNLEDVYGSSPGPSILPQIQGLSLDSQSLNQHLPPSYPSCNSSAHVVPSQSFGIHAYGNTVLSSHSAAFAQQSQSFIEGNAVNHHSAVSSPVASATILGSNLSDWGSPDGKLDWGIQGDELNKMRNSSTFVFKSNGGICSATGHTMEAKTEEPDVLWDQSLVKDGQSALKPGQFGFEEEQQQVCHFDNNGGLENFPAWVEQMYMEQEQLVA